MEGCCSQEKRRTVKRSRRVVILSRRWIYPRGPQEESYAVTLRLEVLSHTAKGRSNVKCIWENTIILSFVRPVRRLNPRDEVGSCCEAKMQKGSVSLPRDVSLVPRGRGLRVGVIVSMVRERSSWFTK